MLFIKLVLILIKCIVIKNLVRAGARTKSYLYLLYSGVDYLTNIFLPSDVTYIPWRGLSIKLPLRS